MRTVFRLKSGFGAVVARRGVGGVGGVVRKGCALVCTLMHASAPVIPGSALLTPA